MTGVANFAESDGTDEFELHLAELRRRWVALPDKPEEDPESTLRGLWLAAADTPCSIAVANSIPLPKLDGPGRARLQQLILQRVSGVPLAHITGRQSFMGLELLAGPEALVPRQETELLGRAAVELLRQIVLERGRALVVDLCTGSGNLALALAHHEPACDVLGGDISAEAIRLARRNAERTSLADRVGFMQGDLFAPFASLGLSHGVDMVVCNPPYVSSAKVGGMPPEIAGFEPRLAFDGGAFGISILFRLVTEAPQFLKPRSWLCFEVGAGQGERMAARLERAGAYQLVQGVCDGAGRLRALLAQTRG